MEDQNHLDRMVHFFLYDYRFERVWKNPDNDIEKLSRHRAVLSPDFSMYLEMASVMQLYNVFRNRWCGAYWASKGIRVIPTVNWGDESTFDFCFEGIEKGSVVAVSTYMASEHDNRCDQKEWFMAGTGIGSPPPRPPGKPAWRCRCPDCGRAWAPGTESRPQTGGRTPGPDISAPAGASP